MQTGVVSVTREQEEELVARILERGAGEKRSKKTKPEAPEAPDLGRFAGMTDEELTAVCQESPIGSMSQADERCLWAALEAVKPTQTPKEAPAATTQAEPTVRTVARSYTDRRWHVFPVDDQKRPCTAHGFKDASLDPEQFSNSDGIGIATGAVSGLVVIDLDEKGGKHGIEEFKKLMQGHPDIVTRTVKTPTGGAHLYFKHNGKLKTRSDHPAAGIDFKAEGGYVVAPPTVVKSGNFYTVVRDVEPAELPEWLRDVFKNDVTLEPGAPVEPGKSKKKVFKALDLIREGARNDTLYRTACSLASKGIGDNAVYAAIQAENKMKCRPPLADEELQTLVNSACTFNRQKPPTGASPANFNLQTKLIFEPPDPETQKRASEIYSSGRFIDLCKENFAKVWLGDQHILEGILYTAANLRVINAKEGVHLHIAGGTQTGKSDGVKASLLFVHPYDRLIKTFSPMYIFHAAKKGVLHEKMLLFSDDTVLEPEIAALYRNILTSWETGVDRGTVINNEANDLHVPARISMILTSIEAVVLQTDDGQDESRFLTLEVRRTTEQMKAIRTFVQEGHADIKKELATVWAVWDQIALRTVTLHKTIEKDIPIREFKRFLTLVQAHALLCNRTETTDADFDAIEKFLTYSRPMIDSSTPAFTRKEAAIRDHLTDKPMTVSEIVDATGMTIYEVYRALRGVKGTFQNPTGGLMAKEPRLIHKEERSETLNNVHSFWLKSGGK